MEKLPEHVKQTKIHFDHLPERIQAATHAGVKGKHLRAVTVLGAPFYDAINRPSADHHMHLPQPSIAASSTATPWHVLCIYFWVHHS